MNRIHQWFCPPPVKARHIKKTFVFSQDDDTAQPSRHLVELVLDAARTALDTDLSGVSARMHSLPHWPDCWPGEHYRLLAALVRVLRPARVIDIGTNTGLSALSMKQCLQEGATLYTFDIVPWQKIPHTCLVSEDFQDGRMTQVVADLGQAGTAEAYRDTIREASLIFVDGPKDGMFEAALLRNLERVPFSKPAYLIFDDIKDRNMQGIWRGIKAPKMDITSLGHWTGTGIVCWDVPRHDDAP